MLAEIIQYKDSGKYYLTYNRVEIPNDTPLFDNHKVREIIESKIKSLTESNYSVRVDDGKYWYNHFFFKKEEEQVAIVKVKYRKDIGIDELTENLFRIILTDDKDNQIHVFGETEDDVVINADKVHIKLNRE